MSNEQEEYATIKSHGYRIDVRGPRFTLIKDTRASSYDTMKEAVAAALVEIDPKLIRYRNGV